MVLLLREENIKREKLSKEYSLLREELLDRSYKTWVISTVLIIGSLLVAFTPVTVAFPVPVLSIVLIAVAFVLHATSERVSAIGYSRLHELEYLLQISGTTSLFESEISGKWWYLLRKSIAYVVFVILSGFYLVMIFSNTWLLTLAIGAGLILILAKESVPYKKTKANNNQHSNSVTNPENEVTLLLSSDASSPIVMKCKNWEEFLNCADLAQKVSVTFRESDKMFEADALKGNQIVAYVGPMPDVALLLKEYLRTNLSVASENVFEGKLN